MEPPKNHWCCCDYMFYPTKVSLWFLLAVESRDLSQADKEYYKSVFFFNFTKLQFLALSIFGLWKWFDFVVVIFFRNAKWWSDYVLRQLLLDFLLSHLRINNKVLEAVTWLFVFFSQSRARAIHIANSIGLYWSGVAKLGMHRL